MKQDTQSAFNLCTCFTKFIYEMNSFERKKDMSVDPMFTEKFMKQFQLCRKHKYIQIVELLVKTKACFPVTSDPLHRLMCSILFVAFLVFVSKSVSIDFKKIYLMNGTITRMFNIKQKEKSSDNDNIFLFVEMKLA